MTRVLRPRTVLAVQNLERSRRYYVDILGFTEDVITTPDGHRLMIAQEIR